MIVTIHQPEHMPWTGYFHKMHNADVYVLLDSVQFKKNNWQNRNRIAGTAEEAQWLTVPVQLKGHISQKIFGIKINYATPWEKKYLGRIQNTYRRAPYYSAHYPEIEQIIHSSQEYIADLNIRLIEFFIEKLGITTRLIRSSELEVEGKSTELLVDICQKLGASTYLSGPDGRNYMDLNLWDQAGIGVEFHQFIPPVYDAPNFLPGLSTLDLLFNYGPESARMIGLV